MHTTPYPWPFDGDLDPARLALVVAGAQHRWIGRSLGAASAGAAITEIAGMVRGAGGMVVWVRHRDLPGPSRRACDESRRPSTTSRGSNEEFTIDPRHGDKVVDASGIDGFFGSRLDTTLRSRGVTHLVVAGFGLEGPVHSTLRSANDRGYECLLLEDAAAPLSEETRRAALSTVEMSGGIFGAVGNRSALSELLAGHQHDRGERDR
jgi:nicotinamidase-related amidase